MKGLLWCCIALSGAAALALQVLWLRSAGLVLGATAPTTATVLACYFAGLGLGALGARRGHRHPVRLYGVLELSVGLGAVWSFAVFRVLASDAGQTWLAAAGPVAPIGVVMVALLPATSCLGATLPTIAQTLVATGTLGQRGSLLYALNTFGGACGMLVMGFGLPAMLGVSTSYGVATGASVLAGLGALIVSARLQEVCPAAQPRSCVRLPARVGRLRGLAVSTGVLGLGLEVLWTRLFAQVLHNSVYSFTAIALVFLVALACGAALAALLLRYVSPAAVVAGALLCAASTTIAGVWLFVYMTNGLTYIGIQSGLAAYVGRIVMLAAVTVGPAALASGVILPALWALWGEEGGVVRPFGDLTAANMWGSIVGAVVAGFVMVPTLGLRGSLLVMAVAYVVLADMVALPHSRLRPWAYVALLGIVVADPVRIPLVHLRSASETLQATIEGPHGIVTVVETGDDRQLRLDNYYILGGSAAATNERRQGLLPLLLHPDPQRVAFIGLATGITASAGPALGVQETTVVELVPEVAKVARTHFAAWNGQLLSRSDVRLVLDDGRRYLAASRDHFDVIVSDLFVPWHAGTGNLYAREMYATAARRLAPGGMFCQWLPLYQLTRVEFDTIVHTLRTVFPLVSLWRGDFYPDRPIVALVAQLSPRSVDVGRVSERLARLPAWSRDPLFASPQGLFMLYAGDVTAADDLFAQAPLNTDDRPVIEFLAPRLTRVSVTGDKDWLIGEDLAALYETLETRRQGVADPFLPLSNGVDAARRAGMALYRYALAAARHDEETATRFQAEVRALVPEVILAAEVADTDTSHIAARQELQGLRVEQERVRQRLEAMEQRLRAITAAPEGLR